MNVPPDIVLSERYTYNYAGDERYGRYFSSAMLGEGLIEEHDGWSGMCMRIVFLGLGGVEVYDNDVCHSDIDDLEEVSQAILVGYTACLSSIAKVA